MGKLHHWNEWGKWEVYEGDSGIAVGNRQTGYSVLADKGRKVKILGTGSVTWNYRAGWMGTYTKPEAESLVRKIDKLMSKPSDHFILPVQVPKGTKGFRAFLKIDRETGGKVLAYPKGDYEALSHELGHVKVGHSEGLEHDSTLKEEKEAIREQIKIMREDGLFRPNRAVPKIASGLRGYLRGPRKTRYPRALRIVKEIAAEPSVAKCKQ